MLVKFTSILKFRLTQSPRHPVGFASSVVVTLLRKECEEERKKANFSVELFKVMFVKSSRLCENVNLEN